MSLIKVLIFYLKYKMGLGGKGGKGGGCGKSRRSSGTQSGGTQSGGTQSAGTQSAGTQSSNLMGAATLAGAALAGAAVAVSAKKNDNNTYQCNEEQMPCEKYLEKYQECVQKNVGSCHLMFENYVECLSQHE